MLFERITMKFDSLESLRGVAALLVALSHSSFLYGQQHVFIANAGVFVDFFFVLSGFVMAFAYFDKVREGMPFSRFILLRFGRLYPLHLLTLLLWVPYVLAKGYAFHVLHLGEMDPWVKNSPLRFVYNIFLVNSLGFDNDLGWNAPAWSISVEFYTYMVFFFFVLLLRPVYKPVFSLILSVLSYAALVYVARDDPHTLLYTYKYGIFRCMGGFFLGMFVYHLSQRSRIQLKAFPASLIEVALLLIACALIAESHHKAMQLPVFPVFAVIVYVLSIQDVGVVSRFLKMKWMVLLGTLSYSIYMIHMLVFVLAANIWQYVLKLPVSSMTHREGGSPFKVIDTPYADLINLGLIALVIVISYFVYHRFESIFRDSFRRLALRR